MNGSRYCSRHCIQRRLNGSRNHRLQRQPGRKTLALRKRWALGRKPVRKLLRLLARKPVRKLLWLPVRTPVRKLLRLLVRKPVRKQRRLVRKRRLLVRMLRQGQDRMT